jgi:hypothetical protein
VFNTVESMFYWYKWWTINLDIESNGMYGLELRCNFDRTILLCQYFTFRSNKWKVIDYLPLIIFLIHTNGLFLMFISTKKVY